MNEQFSLKELYEVFLKTTYPMEIKGKKLEEGEVIASFDKIQISNFEEIKTSAAATGGYDNRAHVVWDETKGVNFAFTQGVFSKTQLALLVNSQLIEHKKKDNLIIPKRECKESNEEGLIIFDNDKVPVDKIFFYDTTTSEKINYVKVDDTTFKMPQPFKDFIVDYNYIYNNTSEELIIGRSLYDGYIKLEAKTKIVEDKTGIIKTAIIRIPKLKITSDLSITLGQNTPPISGKFSAVGYPIGKKSSKEVMEIFFLEDNIESDIM